MYVIKRTETTSVYFSVSELIVEHLACHTAGSGSPLCILSNKIAFIKKKIQLMLGIALATKLGFINISKMKETYYGQ